MVNEYLNSEEKAIADMLGALPRVSVPNDFDFRVKARIAAGEPSKGGFAWFPLATRLALPMLLLVAIGGYFGYQAIGPASREVAVETNIEPVNIAPAVEIPVNKSPVKLDTGLIAETVPNKSQDVNSKVPLTVSTSNNEPKPERVGGSVDSAIRTSRPIYPRGVDPNAKTPVVPKDFDNPGQISAKDVLNFLGAEVVYSETGWKVESVKANSSAQRAGLKSGDLVEAINEQPIGEKTSFKGRFAGKNLRLKREGQNIDIDLQKP